MIYYLDLIGTFVFAVSGTITGLDRKFDLFGATVVGFVTAVGGGTLRDVLIGAQPVGWMQDTTYLWVVLAAVVLTMVGVGIVRRLHRTLFLFDALGIGVFTVLGLQKALSMGLNPWIAVMMGVMSAVFGGVIRDILCSEQPLIFRKEVYATACLAGGVIYIACMSWDISKDYLMTVAILVIVLIRLLAVKYHWYLPTLRARAGN